MAAAAAVSLARVRTPTSSPQSRGRSLSPQSLGTPTKSPPAIGASLFALAKGARSSPAELEAVSVEGDVKLRDRSGSKLGDRSRSRTPTLLVSQSFEGASKRKQPSSTADCSLGLSSVGTRGTRGFALQSRAARQCPALAAFVNSDRFETMIGVCIVANCATMGVQAEQLLGKAAPLESFVQVCEHVFTAIFLFEFLLRISFFGWRIYTPWSGWGGSLWNFLDMLLVIVTGVLAVWILPLFGAANFEELQILTVLRAFRLMRLVRVCQRVDSFHDVWLLLRGLMESGRVLFWTVVVIFFITYMFAIFGVVLIGTELQDRYEEASGADETTLKGLVEITNGVFPMMYTLIQVLTLDSWTSVARPIQEYAWWSWLFFYLYIAVAVLVMMNLVTAVIVDNALKNSQKDAAEQLAEQEKERQLELAHFRHIFEQLDVDGNREVTWEEFETAFEDPQLSTSLQLHGITPENCREVFDLLDTGDGTISMEEFFDGIARMEGQAMSADLFRSSKAMESMGKLISHQHQELREDLVALAQLIAPGARLPERTGTLRQRSKESKATKPVSDDASGIKETPSSVVAFAKAGVQVDATSSEEQLARLTSLVTSMAVSVAESRREVRDGLDACSRRISTINADMADLRSSLSLQGVEGVSPRLAAAAGCAPPGCSYPCLSGAAGTALPPKSEWASRLEVARGLCRESERRASSVL